MKINHPSPSHIPMLKQLWMEAFQDTDAFVDRFFQVAFAPERCCCIIQENAVLAAAYWFDTEFLGKKAAYVYAVATANAYQGKGLCRQLMTHVHQLLANNGYAGAMLVPGDPGLREMYGKMGYQDFGGISEFSFAAAEVPLAVTEISPVEYATLRRAFLCHDGVVQEGENLRFLRQFYRFYQGENCLFAAASTGCELFAAELLGDANSAPGILAAFHVPSGVFRVPGETPFAMYHALDGGAAPGYFAFAFD